MPAAEAGKRQAYAWRSLVGLHVAMADALFFFLNSGFGRLP